MWIDVIEVEHGADSKDCQSIGYNQELKQRNSPIMKVNPKVWSSNSRSSPSGSTENRTMMW